jgi:hypothetical protein
VKIAVIGSGLSELTFRSGHGKPAPSRMGVEAG